MGNRIMLSSFSAILDALECNEFNPEMFSLTKQVKSDCLPYVSFKMYPTLFLSLHGLCTAKLFSLQLFYSLLNPRRQHAQKSRRPALPL